MPGYFSYLSIFNQYLLILTPGPQRKKKKKSLPTDSSCYFIEVYVLKEKGKEGRKLTFLFSELILSLT